MLSGVSPCAICHRISPLFKSIALICPYGGLINGRPWTDNVPEVSACPAEGVRSAAASAPAPPLRRGPLVAIPWIHPKSPESFGSPGTNPNETGWLSEYTYRICVSGSYDPPAQFVLLMPMAS